ncbi:MAG: acyl-CoA dehydrogenase [Ottowia sp.]|nr:acyl-CoA dehydrogenase [Ottowia sp.]
MNYIAPIKDMLFVMHNLADLSAVCALPDFSDTEPELAQAVLDEAAKFSQSIFSPLNQSGDQYPSTYKDGAVTTSPGFKKAFSQFCQAGWQSMVHPQRLGGQGLPRLIANACNEMFNAANLSLSLCPMLSDGVIEALLAVGSTAQQQQIIPALMTGKATGTMNLTEPQAGSDLAMVRTRAQIQEDGSYKISGTKIYISYGEHDLTENIIHLVLARTPHAPEGVKGISLFMVPKWLINADGSHGQRNDVHCVSIEHKLGIKASPTAVLQFGDQGGATGYIVGTENRGLEYMFIMMNTARFAVGTQGIAIAERAYQNAVHYARERIQGKDLSGSATPVAIIHHPDIKRMLMTMRATIEGARAIAYVSAAACDLAHHHTDMRIREENRAFYALMVPIIKGYCTEMATEVASLGVQVHGGMGYIEETGAAQLYRDARILSIYEGTTAIQANDLVQRKTVHDGGAAVRSLCARIIETETALAHHGKAAMAQQLAQGRHAIEQVLTYLLSHIDTDTKAVFAGSVPYLKLMGIVCCAWQLARATLAALTHLSKDPAFYQAKIMTVEFFYQSILVQSSSLAEMIIHAGAATIALPTEQF